MTTYTELFGAGQSLLRKWFASTLANAASTYSVNAPTGARCAIISAVGAGGWKQSSSFPGGGAAFARTKILGIVDNEQFDIQVGSTAFSLDAGTSSADSIIRRVSASNAIVCKAARGTGILANLPGNVPPVANGGTPGLDTDCVGDIKRSGKYGTTLNNIYEGGGSGDDLNDLYSLGFGGRGGRHPLSGIPGDKLFGQQPAASWGCGGIHLVNINGYTSTYAPGAGRVCIEFFTKDLGYF